MKNRPLRNVLMQDVNVSPIHLKVICLIEFLVSYVYLSEETIYFLS